MPRILVHDELSLFSQCDRVCLLACCPYCDCGVGREKGSKYITAAVRIGVLAPARDKQPMQPNADCNSSFLFVKVSVRLKTVYVTTVYASQTYRTSRNRSNRMWISKQSNLKGKPRERSNNSNQSSHHPPRCCLS